MATKILCVIGPTASGKSARAVEEAVKRGGEIISVDSRQVYRGLDIGSEKISREEMRGVPHHLIDVRDPKEPYSAGDFVADATRLIREISARGKLPILAGGSHFYFDALFKGLPPPVPENEPLRTFLTQLSDEDLYARVLQQDPKRAAMLDPKNRRRLIRALEIIEAHGKVPKRTPPKEMYDTEWIIIDPPLAELKRRIDEREALKFPRGLVEEVRRVRELVGDERLNELGLEYRIVGEYLRGERSEESMLPALSRKLWQYARRQKAWLRKLKSEIIAEAEQRPGKN
jgi:tRNA dimethylallyltransferase